jgi:hypothetical protein
MSLFSVEYTGKLTLDQRLQRGKKNAIDLTSAAFGMPPPLPPLPPPCGQKRQREEDSFRFLPGGFLPEDSFSTPGGKRTRRARSHNGANIARSHFYPHTVWACGKFKNVYKAYYADGGPHDKEPCVYKAFKSGDVFETEYFADDVITTCVAQGAVAAFNRLRIRSGIDNLCIEVFMNQAAVWQETKARDNGRYARLIVEPMIEGDFIKFNSNSGHSNGDELMSALSHFSYHHSQGQELLCDVQGGKYDSCYVLTDPVVMSLERKYGPTDLGEGGISNFFHHHKCSRFCKPHWQKFLGARSTIPVQEGTTMESITDARASSAGRSLAQKMLDNKIREARLQLERARSIKSE